MNTSRHCEFLVLVGALLILGAMLPAPASAGGIEPVRLLDQCDPDGEIPQFFIEEILPFLTVQPGCVPHPHSNSVDLEEFFDELPEGGHGGWKIDAPSNINEDESFLVVNEGGILFGHSFTRVEEFGGTCLGFPIDEFFNQAVEEQTPPPECADIQSEIVPPGTMKIIYASELGVGTHKFQCLVHPWMRVEVEIRPSD